MYESLTTRLARVPDDTVVFPGHLYSAEPSASMGETRRTTSSSAPDRPPSGWPCSGDDAGERPRRPVGRGCPADGTVVVVGASLAGLRAVQGLRDEGFPAAWSWSATSCTSPMTAPRCPSRCWPAPGRPSGPCWPTGCTHSWGSSPCRPAGRSLDAEAARVTLDDGTVLEADGWWWPPGPAPATCRGPRGCRGHRAADPRRLAGPAGPGAGRRAGVPGGGGRGRLHRLGGGRHPVGPGCEVTVVEALPAPLPGPWASRWARPARPSTAATG